MPRVSARVELVGLGAALPYHLVEFAAEQAGDIRLGAALIAGRTQPQPQFDGFAGGDRQPVPPGALGAALIGVDGGAPLITWSLMPSLGYGVFGATP
jgi:hypothetical protein